MAREIAAEHGVEVVTVIEPEAEIAAAITETGRVGVLATPATVEGGAYRRALGRQGRGLEVTEVAAPDLAPIIQSGFPFDQSVVETVRSYCEPLRAAAIDTLILGCTHYPLVAPMLQRMLGRDVRLVSAGHAIAASAQRILESAAARERGTGEGDYRFLCTATPNRSASSAPGSCRCRSATSSASDPPGLALITLRSDERIHTRADPGDTRTAMKAGDRDRVGTLRMITNSLQQDEKEGDGDAVAVLQRERKKRIEAAEAFASGGVRIRPRPSAARRR